MKLGATGHGRLNGPNLAPQGDLVVFGQCSVEQAERRLHPRVNESNQESSLLLLLTSNTILRVEVKKDENAKATFQNDI